MVWKITDPQGSESKKIVWEVARYLHGRGLDLGAGAFKVLPQAIAVDNGDHIEKFQHYFQPDIRAHAEKLDMFASGSMDFVYSSHLLEHIVDYKMALVEWWRVIKQGGNLALYLPHKDFYPNCGTEGANPDHKHDFLPQDIIDAMPDGFDMLECQERDGGTEYSMLLVFKKVQGRKREFSYKNPKPTGKTALVCRFGAFGDLMQSSSVWAGLKKQGYHVTLMTSYPGAAVVEHDPNIDARMILERDQIPNAHLADFWAWQAAKYDKFINLSESVEGTFLAMPGRTPHTWTPAGRHALMNHNYVEFQHMLAGVPHDPQIKFFSTAEERHWARKERERVGGEYVILWSLAGSSVHKTWAGLDHIIASLMLNYKGVNVVLCGGPEGVILEAGWENERRVKLTCGKWSIRQTLSFIEVADMVIGPETGVLNAAANLPIPKILFLSHSTKNNLSRDWVNTVSLSSRGTKCTGRGNDEAPACHQMHYGWKHCTKDEDTGTAQCQRDITVPEVYWNIEQFVDAALGIERTEAA